jgi:hypothetical protein
MVSQVILKREQRRSVGVLEQWSCSASLGI